MATKWQRVTIEIPDAYTPLEREAIAEKVLDYIRYRTKEKNQNKNNRPFAGYSDAYAKSIEFKIAGKSKSDVNLTQSGDTLAEMDLLSHRPGAITIGYEKGSKANAIADGNIRGTYGHSKPVGPKRDWLGITQGDLEKILERFPLNDRKKSLERAQTIVESHNRAQTTDDEDDGEGEDG